ncbi:MULTISPECIES: FkbM family methyltransferase [Oerskovia]|uniref:FkbM family methyltransferase n=2 Tax=Oerskovia TaxID=162491 RepID=A0ABR8V3G7_9CELL|nr:MULTISPECIES: FkbM family methyltransferase [Oerskovia]MBD7999212.1 FkbM family methyltransferase [Oerskovia gallyi]MBM7498361.1 FkbM family methyltransferase [Oerskovia paurometabola]
MPDAPFISYAQNGEDVVLWRALQSVTDGRYVEVGANHPTHDSVTRAFYDRGWSGITVEPVEYFAELHRESRPRDIQVQAAITSEDVEEITLHVIPDTGLSTLDDSISEQHEAAGIEHVDIVVKTTRLDDLLAAHGYAEKDVHFLLIDVEGAEADALRSIDLTVWRPWVVVVEATLPNSTTPSHTEWEPNLLAAGYEFCLFDGVSRFYVAQEHAAELKAKLQYPACALDRFVNHILIDARIEINERTAELDDLTRQLLHWRQTALDQWAAVAAAQASRDADRSADQAVLAEMEAMRHTLSWRVTRPLRLVRRIGSRLKTAR